MLLMQGLDDPVVPPAQSAAFAGALTERGIPCTYLAFEGEAMASAAYGEQDVAALAAELAFYEQLFRLTTTPGPLPAGPPPTTSGILAGSAGDLGGAGLADDGDPDLAGVGQLLLDLLGDVAGDHLRLDVVDRVRPHHHPDLAAGLHGEDLLHARRARRRSPRAAPAA